MTSKKHWIPPPCQTSSFNKKESKTALARKKQGTSVLEVISLEIAKLENLVSSLDEALKENKNLISPKVQNETDLDKERKHLSEIFSNMHIWQGEQRNLLEDVRSEINHVNSSMALFSGNFKRNEEAKENQISALHEELDFLEKRYIKHLTCLKKHLLSQKTKSKELHTSVETLRKELFEKEEKIQCLSNMCHELKASVTEISKKNEELQTANQQLIENIESEKPQVTSEHYKKELCEPSEQQVSNCKVESDGKIQRKVVRLEMSKRNYQEKMKKLERKFKKSQDTVTKLRADYEKEKATWETKLPEMSSVLDAEIKNLKEERSTQENQICMLNEVLTSKNKELENLCKANEELKQQHSSEVTLLRSELQKVLNSEHTLRNQLQHLKSSYAGIFSDPSVLDRSSSVT